MDLRLLHVGEGRATRSLVATHSRRAHRRALLTLLDTRLGLLGLAVASYPGPLVRFHQSFGAVRQGIHRFRCLAFACQSVLRLGRPLDLCDRTLPCFLGCCFIAIAEASELQRRTEQCQTEGGDFFAAKSLHQTWNTEGLNRTTCVFAALTRAPGRRPGLHRLFRDVGEKLPHRRVSDHLAYRTIPPPTARGR